MAYCVADNQLLNVFCRTQMFKTISQDLLPGFCNE